MASARKRGACHGRTCGGGTKEKKMETFCPGLSRLLGPHLTPSVLVLRRALLLVCLLGYSPVLPTSAISFCGSIPQQQKCSKEKSTHSRAVAARSVRFVNVPDARGYIRKFLSVAQAAQDKYGIPVSISIAQGIFESASGGSVLAQATNNHFGIKCFRKNCPEGHCSEWSDDNPDDRFRIYKTPEASWRSHSRLLASKKYNSLIGSDYIGWAEGLQRLGYATDKRYAKRLIKVIEKYDLSRFDLNTSSLNVDHNGQQSELRADSEPACR